MPGDADARPDADLPLHFLREAMRARDHEVARRVVAQQQRRALPTNELRGNTKDRVEQIECSTIGRDVDPLSCACESERDQVDAWLPAVTDRVCARATPLDKALLPVCPPP
jgi:hypothetical protein